MTAIARICQRLEDAYGDLGWWPADTRFEILIGAVLVQNTAWRNASLAIEQLRAYGWLDAQALHALDQGRLAAAIHSSGYHTVKARRLQSLCRWFLDAGGFASLDRRDAGALRASLLKVNGIGPETCDDILLYAFNHPVFVIDAYTRRLFGRLGLVDAEVDYEVLRARFESALPTSPERWQNIHAVIVEHARLVCRQVPHCEHCLLADACAHFRHADNGISGVL